jgi:hypothetical protein
VNQLPRFAYFGRIAVASVAILSLSWQQASAQQAPKAPQEKNDPKSTDKTPEKKPEAATPENPAQIEQLETRIRFEENGDSRKEVHAHVKINSELGVRQFARLNFDYNRSFESVEIPLVRVTHANGGTSDVLPSAITDSPNPAVVDYPAYHDVRVKSVRILGLSPGDSLEYRVITTVTKHPLAPNFWLDHSFDRTGVVSKEYFELDVPELWGTQRQHHFTPPDSTENTKDGRQIYRWHRVSDGRAIPESEFPATDSDIVFTTFRGWSDLADRLKPFFEPRNRDPDIAAKASELAKTVNPSTPNSSEAKTEAFYDFVSQKIKTVDLPLGATGFHARNAWEILKSGYATQEDKYVLFAALANSTITTQMGLLPTAGGDLELSLPRPSLFDHLLAFAIGPSLRAWLDLNVEVAPFKFVPSQFRGRKAFLSGAFVSDGWRQVDESLPYRATQTVTLDASLNPEGKLTAKVHYSLRGDNELLLRVAFHQSAKDKWKDLANLLAISDGFRGQVSSVNVSDPYATREPFTIDYEITMPKFVDWSKKPVRIPALLPQVALPDPPAKPVAGSAVSPIELGTPLEVETSMILKLPPGTTARYPTGTSVERDYATFTSQYGRTDSTITASRHIKFILREVPASRAFDYNAFIRAVQNDSAQDFTLERAEPLPAKTNSASPNPAAPPNPTQQKPN